MLCQEQSWKIYNQYQGSIGGGPQSLDNISPVEERILNLVGWFSATGDPKVAEAQVPTVSG